MAAIHHPLGRPRALSWPAGRPGLGHLPNLPSAGQVNWWVTAALALVGVSAMLPVLQNSTATSRGFEIQELQAERAQLDGDLRVLETDVAALTSLERLQRRAAELGLHPAGPSIFLTVAEAGPAPAKIPAEYLPDPAPKRGGTESWWRSLVRWLPLLPD